LWVRGGRDERALRPNVPQRSAEGERRILVIANETVGGEELLAILRHKVEGVQEHVLVVCPALNSQVRTWTSDEDGARAAAQSRLDASLAQLASEGIQSEGEVGDGDPLQAMEDALRTFGADEIVISTHPEGRSHWLAHNVVGNARERFDVPITHVVVDLEAHS
jgi:GABA permease